MSIFVVSHKELADTPAMGEGYRPFFVGPNREQLGSTGGVIDGSGDNIAELNSSFCELTALYWVWKNCQDHLKGIVHYRRFFEDPAAQSSLMRIDSVKAALSDSDLILPEKYWLLHTVRNHYKSHHEERDLELLRDSIASVQPSYLKAFDECMQLKFVYPYNMLIAKAEVYDSYCSWLFSVMFDLRNRLLDSDVLDRDVYQSRVYGFLSERLMNVYVTGSGLNVREIPVLLTERNLKRSISMGLASLLHSRG